MLDATSTAWLDATLDALRVDGFAVVTGVLPENQLERTRTAMYEVSDRIERDVGRDRLDRAGELGVLRLMMKYDEHFLRLLEVPEVLQIVDAMVSETAVLHLQNGFILPSLPTGESPDLFQLRFHRDFPRVLNGCVMSVNVMIAVDEFSESTGGTLVVPGSHQLSEPPDEDDLRRRAVSADAPPGSLLVFDSTLWHAAGENTSGADRLAINHQFTRSYLKQQIDYVRALGDDVVQRQPPRTQQLLGWYTRVPTSLDEYYRPPEERLYRAGQG